MKITAPILALTAMWPWMGQLLRPVVRLLGGIDLAGGIGVLLSAPTRRRRLTVLAALGSIAL